MIYYSVQLLLTLISSSIVDRAGRRPLLIISMAGSALVLFFLAIYFYITTPSVGVQSYSILPIIGLIAFVIIFGLGMQSVPICMLGELFPTNVKAFALCLADVYFSVMATIASKFLQHSKDSYGLHITFLGFSICSAIGLIFIILYVPETKGKTLEDIQKQLRGETHYEDQASDPQEMVYLKAW